MPTARHNPAVGTWLALSTWTSLEQHNAIQKQPHSRTQLESGRVVGKS